MGFVDGLISSISNNKTAQEIGIGGFAGFARVNESIQYSNTVPVDVLEDGSNASDDILNNPIVVTMDGEVGDIFVPDPQYPEIPTPDTFGLGEITALLPSKSNQQLQRINQINNQIRDAVLQAQRAARIGQNVYNFVSGNQNAGKSEQQKFVDYMEAIHFSRQPIKISVTYKNYDNMALQNLTINRDNSNGALKFSASFIQLSFVSLIYSEVSQNYSSPSSAASGRTSGTSNNGGQNPEAGESSLISSLLSGFR